MSIIDTFNIFENNELVLMKSIFEKSNKIVIKTDVGIKDRFGNITEIITLISKTVD